MGGGDEVKVVSVETCGQLDAGWLAATHPHFPKKIIALVILFTVLHSGQIKDK